MRWRDYVATLPEGEHRRLMIGLGAALRSVRLASQVATEDGELEDARNYAAAAAAHLADVLQLLNPPSVGD